MPRLTRNSSRSVDEDEEGNEQETNASLSWNGLPTSDVSKERKFIISKVGLGNEEKLCIGRHPRTRQPTLLRISETCCEEMLNVGDNLRSWFYGENLIADGRLRLLVPLHPLHLALPYLIYNKTKFLELDEILSDAENPALALLEKNKQLLTTLKFVADIQEVCDSTVYRYNEEKALQWLKTRFERVRICLQEEAQLHTAILESSEVLDRYAFGVLSDSLCDEAAVAAKEFLNITEAKYDEAMVDMNMYGKRRAEDEEEAKDRPAKKPRESIAQKQLQKASKGIKSIANFFAKKPAA